MPFDALFLQVIEWNNASEMMTSRHVGDVY